MADTSEINLNFRSFFVDVYTDLPRDYYGNKTVTSSEF